MKQIIRLWAYSVSAFLASTQGPINASEVGWSWPQDTVSESGFDPSPDFDSAEKVTRSSVWGSPEAPAGKPPTAAHDVSALAFHVPRDVAHWRAVENRAAVDNVTSPVAASRPEKPASGNPVATFGLMPLTPLTCQTFSSGTHVISGARIVSDGKSDCIVIQGDASVVIENSDISNANIPVRVEGGERVVIRNNRLHDFVNTGILVRRPTGSSTRMLGASVLIEGNEIFGSRTGCMGFQRDNFNCRGPRGNGIVISHARGAQVIGNRVYDVEFGCFRAHGSSEYLIFSGNYCEAAKFDRAAYFEFNWHGITVVNNHWVGMPGRGSGPVFTNCTGAGTGHQVVFANNIVEGFDGDWQVGAWCESLVHDNIISCDNPQTPELETGYFGIAVRNGRTRSVKDNFIKSCQIGIAIEQSGTAGAPAWIEGNAFQDVATPITGYVHKFSQLRSRTAHRPLIRGHHVIHNNRDALTLQIVDPR